MTTPKAPDLRTRYNRAARHAEGDIAAHQMTIVIDQPDQIRLIRFRRPDTGMHWFDLATTPGTLIFTGDAGAWVFRREEDMFAWFRGAWSSPDYVAEKVVAVDRRVGGTHEYDPAIMWDHMREMAGYATARYDDTTKVRFYRRLVNHLNLYREDLDLEHDARPAVDALMLFEFQGSEPFQDAWGWDCTAPAHLFLYALAAIRWGIRRYDEERAS